MRRRRHSWTAAIYAMLIIGAIAMLLPFLWMIGSSLKTDPEIQHVPPTMLPRAFQWHNYIDALGRDKMDLWPDASQYRRHQRPVRPGPDHFQQHRGFRLSHGSGSAAATCCS